MRSVCIAFAYLPFEFVDFGVSERCMTKWYIEDRSDNGLLHVSSFNRSKSERIAVRQYTSKSIQTQNRSRSLPFSGSFSFSVSLTSFGFLIQTVAEISVALVWGLILGVIPSFVRSSGLFMMLYRQRRWSSYSFASTVAQESEQSTCAHHKYTRNPSHTIH